VGPEVGPENPGNAPAAAAAPDRTAANDAILRELTRRLDALEKAVFPGGASTAAQQPAPPPES
jgi:hypothetical protein